MPEQSGGEQKEIRFSNLSRGELERIRGLAAFLPDLMQNSHATVKRLRRFNDDPFLVDTLSTIAWELGIRPIMPEDVAKAFGVKNPRLAGFGGVRALPPNFTSDQLRQFEQKMRQFLKRGSREAGKVALLYIPRCLMHTKNGIYLRDLYKRFGHEGRIVVDREIVQSWRDLADPPSIRDCGTRKIGSS